MDLSKVYDTIDYECLLMNYMVMDFKPPKFSQLPNKPLTESRDKYSSQCMDSVTSRCVAGPSFCSILLNITLMTSFSCLLKQVFATFRLIQFNMVLA